MAPYPGGSNPRRDVTCYNYDNTIDETDRLDKVPTTDQYDHAQLCLFSKPKTGAKNSHAPFNRNIHRRSSRKRGDQVTNEPAVTMSYIQAVF